MLLLEMDVFLVSVVVYYVFGRVCGCPHKVGVKLSQFKVVGFGMLKFGIRIHPM